MKAEIVFRGCQSSIEIPEEVCLAGVTVMCNGDRCSALELDFVNRREEEIVITEGMKVILHYYTAPSIVEIAKEFANFEGMKYLEIEQPEYSVEIYT